MGQSQPIPISAGVQRVMPAVYSELRSLAAAALRHERRGHTLQPTALVHEAYLRLADVPGCRWQSRAHFLAAAARVIRHILVDHARARACLKRAGGGPGARETLVWTAEGVLDLVALDEALGKLAAQHPDRARIVEMRFFGGLTIDETAAATSLSTATIEREWRFARAWLFRELSPEKPR